MMSTVLIWIAGAWGAGQIARWAALPPLVGYLTAGALFAANGLGDSQHWLEIPSEIGVELLLFAVGLKMNPRSIFRFDVAFGTLLHLMLSACILALALTQDLSIEMKIALALTLGFSSTVVAAKGLEARREIRAFHGRLSISILVLQDLVAVTLLAVGGDSAPSPFALGLLKRFLPALLTVGLADQIAKGLEDKKKFEIIFDREVLYHGNLKFYQKLNLKNDKKNIICFASIHREEFENIIQIIENLNLNSIEQIIIIPRHIHFSSKLKSMIKNFNSNKIFISEKFGENDAAYENSKLTFMGGSLFEHGGQNPIEPLSKGCFVLSGQYINNFSEIYADLEDLSLAKVFNGKNNEEIGSAINKYIDMKLNNEANIKDYFNLNIKQLNSIINKVEEC